MIPRLLMCGLLLSKSTKKREAMTSGNTSIDRLMDSPGGMVLASLQTAAHRYARVYIVLFLLAFVTAFPMTGAVVEWLIAEDRLPAGVDIIVVSPVEFLFLQLRMAASFGMLMIAVTLVLHLALFGRHHEAVQARVAELDLQLPQPGRTAVLTLLGVAVLSFGGLMYAWEWLTPLLLAYLTEDAQQAGLSTEWRLSGYAGFIVSLVGASMVGFQTPVVTTLALRLHIVERSVLKALRRHIWFSAFVLGALLSPPDPLSLFLVAMPVIVLFELSLVVDGVLRDGRQATSAQ